MKFDKDKNRGLVTICTYAFITIILAATVIIGVILNMDFALYGSILAPFVYAFAISYILNKLVNFFKRVITTFSKRVRPKAETNLRAIKYVSIILSYVFFLAIIYLFLSIIAPQISESVKDVMNNYKNYINTAGNWINKTIAEYEFLQELFRSIDFENMASSVVEYVISLIKSLSPKFTNFLGSFALEVKNILFALFISIYMLIGKETFKAQSKKILKAVSSDCAYTKVLTMATECDNKFGGFLVGKIIDSLIIGVLCYICCLIFSFPFPALISFIIGVTNIIPIAGPFIGAIPSAFLILLVEPQKVIWFIIFVFILQQLDGNFIGPKILGESTGLSSFWVLTSLIIMGSLYGVMGMVIAVPLCSVIYYEIKIFIERRLAIKELPTETLDYADESEKQLVAKPAKAQSKRLSEHFTSLEAIRRIKKGKRTDEDKKD